MQADFDSLFEKIDALYQAKKIPKMRTLFKGAITNISNLMNLLVRKSLLKENLYNYPENSKSDFFLIEEKGFLDNEKARVIYDRLKSFIEALDYQAHNLPGDTDSINLKYLENSKKLLSYFAFQNINAPGVGINTKTLREMTNKIINSKDQILKRVVQDNLKILQDNFNRIDSIINDIIRYKKERYKVQIRFKVFPFLPENDFKEKQLHENPALLLKRIANFIQKNAPDITFNKYWTTEALKACYTTKNSDYLTHLQSMFLSMSPEKSKAAKIYSPREKLIFIINNMANSGTFLENMYIRLEQNLKFLHSRKKNFIEHIVDILKKAMNASGDEDYFQLEYIDPVTKEIQNDTVNVHDFMTSIKKKIMLFRNLLNPSASIYEKIKRGTEDSLYKFIEDTYFDLLLTKERIIGVNDEIRLRVPKSFRQSLKDIREPIEKLDNLLKSIGSQRRKYAKTQEESFSKSKPTENTEQKEKPEEKK